MEYIVEKIGMSRTITVPAVPVTLLRVLDAKVCEVNDNGSALIAYASGKKMNKAIEGQQKKFGLSAEFNRFATVDASGVEVGAYSTSALSDASVLKTSFDSKGRGFSGVIKRWNFAGGPGSHGSRFHRHGGSIGNAEWPGRVQKGRKMPGHYGNSKSTVKNDVVSFDAQSGILVVKGSVAGANGGFGRIKVEK